MWYSPHNEIKAEMPGRAFFFLKKKIKPQCEKALLTFTLFFMSGMHVKYLKTNHQLVKLKTKYDGIERYKGTESSRRLTTFSLRIILIVSHFLILIVGSSQILASITNMPEVHINFFSSWNNCMWKKWNKSNPWVLRREHCTCC